MYDVDNPLKPPHPKLGNHTTQHMNQPPKPERDGARSGVNRRVLEYGETLVASLGGHRDRTGKRDSSCDGTGPWRLRFSRDRPETNPVPSHVVT